MSQQENQINANSNNNGNMDVEVLEQGDIYFFYRPKKAAEEVKGIEVTYQSLSLISELSGYENLLIYSKFYAVPKDKRNENILQILKLGISERATNFTCALHRSVLLVLLLYKCKYTLYHATSKRY